MGVSGKSTVTALLSHTTHSWLTTLKEGKEIGAVFLDLQKAFESVPHKSLFEKLQQTEISHHIISWISDYLTSREQKVVVDGKSSQFSPVISRVPQGSVLGPLLFLVYVDDLAQLPYPVEARWYFMQMIYYSFEQLVEMRTSFISSMISH